MKRTLTTVLVAAAIVASLSGCYLNEIVDADQMGVLLKNGGVESIVGAGRYSGGLWTDIDRLDVSNKIIEWSDSVWTSDQQSINIKINVTVARPRDPAKLRNLYENFNAVATNDVELKALVLAKIPDTVKSVVPTMTLNQLAGIGGGESEKNRRVLTESIFNSLTKTLDTFGISVIDTSVTSITVDPSYSELLQSKANAALQVSVAEEQGRVKQAEAAAEAKVAEEKVKLLEQQLKQEKSQTDIDLEIARRQQLVEAEKAKTYEQSPEAYKLALIEAYSKVFNNKTVYLPSDSQLFIDLEEMLKAEIAK
jgi:regulator of protease activity HflC (stomatin/prohibitin superfamily)